MRRGGKLVVGAGRYQHQLQLKSFIMCRVTYWIVWLCLPLGIQEGKRGSILAQDTPGPPGLGTSSYHLVWENQGLDNYSICNTHHDQPNLGVRKRHPGSNACQLQSACPHLVIVDSAPTSNSCIHKMSPFHSPGEFQWLLSEGEEERVLW